MFAFEKVKAIIFDLDDTLVQTQLDFTAIKKDIGCMPQDDILNFIDSLDCPNARNQANKIVLSHELADANSSVWLDGAEEFVWQAKTFGLPLAIVTRNCRAATNIKVDNNNIPIDTIFTREDGPPKPDPSVLLSIASNWDIACEHIAYIGDYKYDIEAAHNASMQAWLFEAHSSEKWTKYAQKLTYKPKN